MPRAKVILTTDDLRAILSGDAPLDKLREWAAGELERRIKAGESGGRPKGKDQPRDYSKDFDFGA